MLLAVTTYQWYLAVHILAATVWVGGALMVQLFAIRAQRSHDSKRLADVTADIEFIGMRLFIPASLVLVVFGFLLINEAGYDYKLWVVLAIAVWAASFLTGALFLGPEAGRIAKLTDEHGFESPEVQRRMARVFLISRVELVLLMLIVIDMTIKPGS